VQVGIVIPTLNSAKTLEWTLLSLRQQGGCEVQIVVADSYSTDGTTDLCDKWRVRVLQVPAGSMYRAVNAGLKVLEAEWVGYLNSDDIIYGDGLRRLVDAATSDGSDVAYGQCDFIDSAGRFLYALTPAVPEQLGGLFRRGIFPLAQPATIFRAELVRRLGGFAELKYAADYDFFARADMAGARFARVPSPSVAAFRIHAQQLSSVGGSTILEEKAKIRKTLPRGSPWRDFVSEVQWRAGNWNQSAISLLRAGRLRRGPNRD
jgi:glycosyltransferase involved in cell wall biosynthesis